MTTHLPSRKQQRTQFLNTTPWANTALRAFAQDASHRQYFRLQGGPKPALLMDAPPDKESVTSFANIAEHLLKLGLSAPRIYHIEPKKGFIILEDFGDQTFTRLLARQYDERTLYLLATDCLLALHNHPDNAKHIDLPRRETTLLEETLVFYEWYYPLIQKTDKKTARDDYITAWQFALQQLSASTDVLVLRDFHIDNAMLLENRSGVQRCGLLDFQDATIGPAAYDLMSVLEDARRDIPSGIFAECIQRYQANSQATGNLNDFTTDCAILAAQRHTRVAGLFVRLSQRDGKNHYLQHLPRVIRLLQRRLNHPALSQFKHWLLTYCPTFYDEKT